jgi:hypothetical protein
MDRHLREWIKTDEEFRELGEYIQKKDQLIDISSSSPFL